MTFLIEVFHQRIRDLISHYEQELCAGATDLDDYFDEFISKLIVTNDDLRSELQLPEKLPHFNDPIVCLYTMFHKMMYKEVKLSDRDKELIKEGKGYWKDHENILKEEYHEKDDEYYNWPKESLKKRSYNDIMSNLLNF